MGDVPTTNNSALGTAEAIINASIVEIGKPIVERLILSIPALSFLNIWPLSWLLSYILGKIASFWSEAFQIMGIKLIISIQTEAERSKYAEKEGRLRAILSSGDKDAIDKAKLEADKAFDSFIHYNGSSPIIK